MSQHPCQIPPCVEVIVINNCQTQSKGKHGTDDDERLATSKALHDVKAEAELEQC